MRNAVHEFEVHLVELHFTLREHKLLGLRLLVRSTCNPPNIVSVPAVEKQGGGRVRQKPEVAPKDRSSLIDSLKIAYLDDLIPFPALVDYSNRLAIRSKVNLVGHVLLHQSHGVYHVAHDPQTDGILQDFPAESRPRVHKHVDYDGNLSYSEQEVLVIEGLALNR